MTPSPTTIRRVAVCDEEATRRAQLADVLARRFEVTTDVPVELMDASADLACVVIGAAVFDTLTPEAVKRLCGCTALVIIGVVDDSKATLALQSGAQEVLETDEVSAPRLLRAVMNAIERRNVVSELKDAHQQRELLERQLLQAQKLEALGRLAGGVAHDFNNVLTAILSFSRFVLDQLAAGDPRRDDLVQVLKAADRARSLTRQLLTYSRKQPVEERVLCVNDVVTSVNELLRRTLGENIVVELDLDPNLGSVMMDAGQLEQIVVNMVVNARDAMPDGGRIVLRTENGADGKSVVLVIRDTGTGMTDAVKSRIFEPFFTTKSRDRGTGLGLSTCYGIVKRANGEIVVDSSVTRGTTFSVILPRCALQAANMDNDASVASVPTAGSTGELVLVAEDDDAVRTLTARMLRKHGYRTLEASGADQARKLFDANAPDVALLLTDVVMGDRRGPELALELVTQRPDLPVLFMTGYDDDTLTPEMLRSLPRTQVLVKPFVEALLLQRTRQLLEAEPAHRTAIEARG